ncbi:collagen alpha-1(III) chain-like [Tachyglossus aculeatus]|uniref:collagen alpha-1(III) chain-like n=1 Tax=Tachyglossus aculeatus TaxID=9261 RepID=UPI0018F47EE3|nr:collagen alpha-1(III) chain-like [Tachyglossus aculeatus]
MTDAQSGGGAAPGQDGGARGGPGGDPLGRAAGPHTAHRQAHPAAAPRHDVGERVPEDPAGAGGGPSGGRSGRRRLDPRGPPGVAAGHRELPLPPQRLRTLPRQPGGHQEPEPDRRGHGFHLPASPVQSRRRTAVVSRSLWPPVSRQRCHRKPRRPGRYLEARIPGNVCALPKPPGREGRHLLVHGPVYLPGPCQDAGSAPGEAPGSRRAGDRSLPEAPGVRMAGADHHGATGEEARVRPSGVRQTERSGEGDLTGRSDGEAGWGRRPKRCGRHGHTPEPRGPTGRQLPPDLPVRADVGLGPSRRPPGGRGGRRPPRGSVRDVLQQPPPRLGAGLPGAAGSRRGCFAPGSPGREADEEHLHALSPPDRRRGFPQPGRRLQVTPPPPDREPVLWEQRQPRPGAPVGWDPVNPGPLPRG